MKTINKLIALAFLAVATFSCVEDDDFAVPFTEPQEVNIDGTVVELSTVAGRLAQSSDDIVTFETTNEYVSGYVISSDEGGNWFKELIIQDRPENPTVGVAISLDVNSLFTKYNFGRKVYIKLDGLSAGTENGVLTLGVGQGNSIERIQASRESEVIIRDPETADIVPTVTAFNEFSESNELTWIRLENVQIVGEDLGKSYAAEANDQFDGERGIKSCNDAFGAPATLSTSTFADFKSLTLPSGRGDIDAVLTRTFFGDAFIVSVNGPQNLMLDDENRCDLTPIACGTAAGPGATTLLNENFETQSTGSAAMPAGWSNVQEAGTETWEVYTATGANASLGKSVRCGSFRSGDDSTIAWLVTPQIDFDAQTGEVLSFETSNSFADGSNLQVLFSNDWDGTSANIAAATWQPIVDATVVEDSEDFGNWVFSGNTSLDCATGTGHIAFRYEGSGESATDGTYELDNILLTSN